ncbi:MAG: nucleotide sugar dehydrogenase [Candidatus Omnitrophota bacterium]
MRKAKNMYGVLEEKIDSKQAKICVLGMGYVGLPLGVALAAKNFFVYGFDTNSSRVDKLRKGEQYIIDIDSKDVLVLIKRKRFFPTTKEGVLKEADVIIICVPTPLRRVKVPDISYVVKASKMVGKNLRKGHLVILESTSYPGTTRDVLMPFLAKSGLKEGKDYFLCFSPERVNPGDKKFPLTKIPKIVGGISRQAGLLAKELYGQIIDKVFLTANPEVAETSKLLENTFRLVNIALANEFSIVCNKLGISIWEVIEAAKTKPFGFMPFYPGPGVGGHCLPCDPLYLSWKAKKLGFKTKMIDLASYINHYMPGYVVERLRDLLARQSKNMKGKKILILGVTYKKNVKDLRESSALDVIDQLLKEKAEVDYFDPLIPFLKINGIDLKLIPLTRENLSKYDCAVVITDHSDINYQFIRRHSRLIFDTRNIYKKDYNNVKKI